MQFDFSEIINPKKTVARRMAEAEADGTNAAAAAPMSDATPNPAMTQSQFMKARTLEERMRQQQALSQKLRSLGQ